MTTKELCKQHGITERQLQHVMCYYEISDEKTAAEIAAAKSNHRKHFKACVETARKNGIAYTTYIRRLGLGWSEREAMTIPASTGNRRVRHARKNEDEQVQD